MPLRVRLFMLVCGFDFDFDYLLGDSWFGVDGQVALLAYCFLLVLLFCLVLLFSFRVVVGVVCV